MTRSQEIREEWIEKKRELKKLEERMDAIEFCYDAHEALLEQCAAYLKNSNCEEISVSDLMVMIINESLDAFGEQMLAGQIEAVRKHIKDMLVF